MGNSVQLQHVLKFFYKGAVHLPKEKRAGAGQRELLPLLASERKTVTRQLVEDKDHFIDATFLNGSDELFAGLDQKFTSWLWQGIVLRRSFEYIADNFSPTEEKIDAFFRAVLGLNEGSLSVGRKKEILAPFASVLTFPNRFSSLLQRGSFFADFILDDQPQSVLSKIPNHLGERAKIPNGEICQNGESMFNYEVLANRAILINRHFLFARIDKFQVALCLRNFLSKNGYLFFAGVFYYPGPYKARDSLRSVEEPRVLLPDLYWKPTRAWRVDSCDVGRVRDFAERFPAEIPTRG